MAGNDDNAALDNALVQPEGQIVVAGAPANPGAAPDNLPPPLNQQQLIDQLLTALLARAQALPAPAAANAPSNSSSSKHVARAPDKYQGNGSDKLTPDEFINALQLYFVACKTPAEEWAVAASTHISAHMQTLMFNGMSLDVIADPQQYTWDMFVARFKEVAAMGQLQTDLQIYDQISNMRCSLYDRPNTPAMLRSIESLWPRMAVQPSDGTKIYQVWRALHPELRKQMAINPSNQQQWAVYGVFRQHLVSVAPHFDATVQPMPNPHKRPYPSPPGRK
jgi:hypothetical protein